MTTIGFVVVGHEVLHRAWIDPKDCSHSSPNICGTCDHDGYYAATYPEVPWAQTAAEVKTR